MGSKILDGGSINQRVRFCLSIPNHNNSNDSNTKRNCQKLVVWSINGYPLTRLIPFSGEEMINRNIDEHATSQTHRYRENPVSHGPLRRRVDHDADGHADGARDGKCKSIGRGGEEWPLGHHSQQRYPHRDRCKYFVETHGP